MDGNYIVTVSCQPLTLWELRNNPSGIGETTSADNRDELEAPAKCRRISSKSGQCFPVPLYGSGWNCGIALRQCRPILLLCGTSSYVCWVGQGMVDANLPFKSMHKSSEAQEKRCSYDEFKAPWDLEEHWIVDLDGQAASWSESLQENGRGILNSKPSNGRCDYISTPFADCSFWGKGEMICCTDQTGHEPWLNFFRLTWWTWQSRLMLRCRWGEPLPTPNIIQHLLWL